MSTDTAQTPAGPGSVAAGASSAGSPPSAVDRPEVQLGAAFAGGFLVALILKRLGH